MSNWSTEKYSVSLTIRKMKRIARVTWYLIPVGVTIVEKTKDKKYWRGCGEKKRCLLGFKLAQRHCETAWSFLKNSRQSHSMTQPLHHRAYVQGKLGRFVKETSPSCLSCYSNTIYSQLIRNGNNLSSIYQWIDKENTVYIYNRVLLSYKKKMRWGR